MALFAGLSTVSQTPPSLAGLLGCYMDFLVFVALIGCVWFCRTDNVMPHLFMPLISLYRLCYALCTSLENFRHSFVKQNE